MQFQALNIRRPRTSIQTRLGTTYHESGTLRMGEDPAKSVVNPDSQFHFVTNLYAGDAAACGSANPVMNGVAIRRRLARRLVPEGDAAQPLRPFVQYPPPGAFPGRNRDHAVRWEVIRELAHVWAWYVPRDRWCAPISPQLRPRHALCTIPMPQNYVLELGFFIRTSQTNSDAKKLSLPRNHQFTTESRIPLFREALS